MFGIIRFDTLKQIGRRNILACVAFESNDRRNQVPPQITFHADLKENFDREAALRSVEGRSPQRVNWKNGESLLSNVRLQFKPVLRLLMGDSLLVTLGVGVAKAAICVYDLVTFPVYVALQRPWVQVKLDKATRAVRQNADDPYSSYVRVEKPTYHALLECDTLPKLFKKAVEDYGDRLCLGQREIFGEETETQSDGKQFQKLLLGDYKWFSYAELDQRIDTVAKGLMAVGLKPGDMIMMLAETRLEWFLTAQAVFRVGATIGTLYTNLGNDGIVHGLKETQVTHLVTTSEYLPRIKQMIAQVPALKCIIFFETYKQASASGFNVDIFSFSQLEEKGKSNSDCKFVEAKSTDPAIVMYTSGSTGTPKGVIITHKNVVGTIRGFFAVAHTLQDKHVYMAYLPLAHVLELAAETFFISVGVTIGYSSAITMLDKSTGIKQGCQGDASVLKPTVMAAVPLVLDRIRKAVTEQMENRGPLFNAIFHFLMDYKKFWTGKGFNTPIVNYLICRKVQQIFGGKLQFIVCGSAPLSPETHHFIRSCLNVVVIQGYGLTETAAGSTLMDFNDLSVGRVGPPLYGLQVRLHDWPEGNYSAKDKPNPRGEIVVGGDCVSAGYFKNEALTNESFKEENGTRWFYTGDIGEIQSDGSIRIIDRKKDLVKLQFGEYVSLGKVETELKQSELVDNICVYGDSKQAYVVAVISPNEKALTELAKEFGKDKLPWPEMCNDPQVTEAVLNKIIQRGKAAKLVKMEIPVKVKLCHEPWTPENGLCTAALKIKRKSIEEKYKSDIEEMYTTKPSS